MGVNHNGAILLIISFFAIGHMSALSKCISNRHLVTLAGNYECLSAVSATDWGYVTGKLL